MAQHPGTGRGNPELMTVQSGFSGITKAHQLYACELISDIKQQGDSVYSYKQHEAPFLLLKDLDDSVSHRWVQVVMMTLAPEERGCVHPRRLNLHISR